MNKIMLYSACLIAVMADMLFVIWAKSGMHPLWLLLTALLVNIIATMIWTYSLKLGIDASTAITTYALFTIGGCSFLGYVIFNENLTSLNFLGLLLAAVAIIMIST